MNLIKLSGSIDMATGGGSAITLTYKRASTTIVTQSLFGAASPALNLATSAVVFDAPATVSSTAYSTNVSAGTYVLQTIFLDEIMGALEPDNDNQPLSMVG
jgi:hypothetical protein